MSYFKKYKYTDRNKIVMSQLNNLYRNGYISKLQAIVMFRQYLGLTK